MGEKEEKGKRKGKINLFPPTKKKKEGFIEGIRKGFLSNLGKTKKKVASRAKRYFISKVNPTVYITKRLNID